MPVLDLTGRRDGIALRLEAGAAFEFLVSLCAFCHGPADVATFEDGPARHRRDARRASPHLLNAIERFGPLAGKVWVNFVGLAAVQPTPDTVPSLLDRISGLPPVGIRRYLLGDHVPAYQGTVGRDVIRRAADGDPAAKARLLDDRNYYAGEAGSMLGPLLAMPDEDLAPLALDILRRWYEEVFRREEAEAERRLTEEAERHRPLLATVSPERCIELVSGIEFVPEAGIRQVVLVPQLAMRPWLLLCEHDETRLFCYPAGPGGAGRLDHARLLRLAQAFADPKRLRLLEAIAGGGARVPELSRRFGQPRSTTYHHLAILRSAGLVKVSSDLERRYTVRPESLEEITGLLEAFLSPGRPGARITERSLA